MGWAVCGYRFTAWEHISLVSVLAIFGLSGLFGLFVWLGLLTLGSLLLIGSGVLFGLVSICLFLGISGSFTAIFFFFLCRFYRSFSFSISF